MGELYKIGLNGYERWACVLLNCHKFGTFCVYGDDSFVAMKLTHSLVLLKMGKIIARNMLSWLELLISRYCCMYLVAYVIYINDARSSKYQIMKYIC